MGTSKGQRKPLNQGQEGRSSILGVVETPLRFFALVVLVAEGILGGVASLSQGTDRTILVVGIVALAFVLVFIVAALAFFRPGSLYGKPNQPKERKKSEDQRLEALLGAKIDKSLEGVRLELLSRVDELMGRAESPRVAVEGVRAAINDNFGRLIGEVLSRHERAYVRVVLTSVSLVGFEGTVGELIDDYLFDEQDLLDAVWHFALIGIIQFPESVSRKEELSRSTRLKLLTRSTFLTGNQSP